MWATGPGKKKLWEVLKNALINHIGYQAAPSTTYIVDPPAGNIWAFPAPMGPSHNFGEADTKCTAFATTIPLNQSVLIKTIDWDLAIMGTIINRPNLSINMGTIWRDKGDDALLYFSKRKAPSSAERVPEVVTPSYLIQDDALKYSIAWFMLAAGKYILYACNI